MAVLLSALLVVFVFFLAESSARAWLRHQAAYLVFPPGMRLRLFTDRDVLPEVERVVRFDVNADGERGSAVPRLRRGDTLFRVLVAGGSQPEGYLLDQETHWPGALQRMLSAPQSLACLGATHVHVGNIARSGVGSEALDLILSRVLPRYRRLQSIVILVGASDVLRWLEQGAPPRPPRPSSTADLFRCHPEGPFGWTPKRLALLELFRRARQRWLRPVQINERAGHWIGEARQMRAAAKVIRATVPDATPMLDHFDRHFRRVIERAKAHADRVLVVRQSWFEKSAYTADELAHMWHGGAGQAWREEVSTYYSIEVTSRLMAQMDARAARAADELGVEQLDLMPILERSLNTYYDFFHLTPAGSVTVASAIAAALTGRQRQESTTRQESAVPLVHERVS